MPSILVRVGRRFRRGDDQIVLRKQEIGRKWRELALVDEKNGERSTEEEEEERSEKNLRIMTVRSKGNEKDARILRVLGREMKLGD